jgi:putative membrane protein
MKNLLSISLSLAFAAASSTAFAAASPDQMFADKAAQAGLAEVAAGELAKSQASSADVKSFAGKMVDDHTTANSELQDIANKSSMTLPTAPSAEQKAAAAKLAKLDGPDFDHAYSKMMVKDHTEVAALFRTEANTGKDARLKAFAAKTLPTIEMHLQMAKQLPSSKTAAN